MLTVVKSCLIFLATVQICRGLDARGDYIEPDPSSFVDGGFV